ncbi:hypothetical protein IW262DRAFT_1419677 [Armillaria fumosa]|nr:hypothetical protein IW262DRAFT_1419677 [Armillaria fumosa]
MKYTVGLVVVGVVLKPTTTFHKISPSLASDGDYTHSPPSRIVGTSTSVAPPQPPTKWNIITTFLFIVWLPSSFESR